MPRYDWEQGFDRPRGSGRAGGGYDRGQRGMRWPSERSGPEGSWDWGSRQPGWAGRQRPPREGGRYDRGIYGDAYPTYGGYPGDDSVGMYYGRRPRPDRYRSGRPYFEGSWSDGSDAHRGFYPESFRMESHSNRGFASGYESQDANWGDRSSGYDDEEVLAAVRYSLSMDNFIDSDQIQVAVADGIVTLTGDVEEYLEVRYAWDDAWDVLGVVGVVNRLNVRTA